MNKRDKTIDDEMASAPRVIFAEVVDSEGLEESEAEEQEFANEDSLIKDMPVRRKRKLPEPDTTQLTRHFALTKEYQPLFTGGKFILSKNKTRAFALNDSKVSLFDVSTGTHEYTLQEDNEEIIQFAISPNEKYIATTNKSFLTRVYLLQSLIEIDKSKKIVANFKTPNQMCLEVCFDPSSRFVAVGTADSHVKVYDVEKGYQTHNFIGHRGVIVQLSFMPGVDSLQLVSSGEDQTVKVWDMVLNKEIAALKGNRGRVTSFQFTNDFKTLIVGARDGKIALYNTHDHYKLITVLDLQELGMQNEEEVTCLQYIFVNASCSLLAVGGGKGQLCLIDIATLKISYLESDYISSEMAFIQHVPPASNDLPHRLITGNLDQNLFTYEIQNVSSKRMKVYKISTRCLYLDEVIDLKIFKPHNEFALMCSNSETLKLMCLTSGEIELYTGHDDIILCLDISVQSQLCLTGAKDNQIRLWKYDLTAPHQLKLQCVAQFKGHSENVTSVFFAPKRSQFFTSVSQDNTLKVWGVPKEMQAFQVVTSAQMTIMAHQKYINCVRISPNDKVIATSSQDKQIKLWDSQNLSLKATLTGHKKGVWDIQFNPAEQLLVSASGDNDLKIWNLTSHQCVSTLQGHKMALVKVVWLNAGLQLASASVDGIVKVWNVSRQACLNSFEMHEEKIWAMDFAETHLENEMLDAAEQRPTLMMLTGGSDSKIKIWHDSTAAEELKQKELKLDLIHDEQSLSKLMRENNLVQAALLSFKLNKLRDFFHVMNRIVNGQLVPPRAFIPGLMVPGVAQVVSLDKTQDPIDSIILSHRSFKSTLETKQPQIISTKSQNELKKVVSLLLKEVKGDLCQLLELTRKLNARQEYARLAQMILAEIFARIEVDQLIEDLKKTGKTKLFDEIMEACEIYGLKHYARADKSLKSSYYLKYVMSQITLQSDLVQSDKVVTSKQDRKRDVKGKQKEAGNLF